MTVQAWHLGKQWGMRRISTADGHFAMIALDQRPPIINLIAQKRGVPVDQVSFADIVAVKRLLVETLGSTASAMLFDPNFALPAALDLLPASRGLIITLEDHRFEDTPGGRKSRQIANWSVDKIKRLGADGVKALVWYRPDASPDVLAHQQTFAEEIGRQCQELDIPFILELLVYAFPRTSPLATEDVTSSETHAHLVVESVHEFAKPRYHVDLFKLESPLPVSALVATNGHGRSPHVQGWFDRVGEACKGAGIPWVMLSAGVTASQFLRVMEYAFTAGASGFLAGRAVWWHALQDFPDLSRCKSSLQALGSETMAQLATLTARAGTPWFADYKVIKSVREEGDFCSAYS